MVFFNPYLALINQFVRLKNYINYLHGNNKNLHLIRKEDNLISIRDIPREYRTEKVCIEAIKKYPWDIEHIDNQTPAICLTAVKKNGLTLEYIKKQTDDLCLHAVKQEGNSLRFVINKTPEICMAAVMSNGNALRYVVNQTPEICLAALYQDPFSIEHIKDKHSIASLVDDGYIKEYLNYDFFGVYYRELKELKRKILIADDVVDSISELNFNKRKSKTSI